MNEEMKVYFKHFGENNKISGNVEFEGAKGIYIADYVDICNYSSIVVHELCHNDKVEWNIKINDGVLVNIGSIIQAFNQIEIGKYVMLAPYVYISDNSHEYYNYNLPISLQLFKKELNKVLIKDGVWIGTGAKIIGNITIGFGTVVAANAVVVRSVPDHCVVAGVPAEIIKICDYRTGEWINVKNKCELSNQILSNRGIFQGYDKEISMNILERKSLDKSKLEVNLSKDIEKLIKDIEKQIAYVVTNIDLEGFDNILKVIINIVEHFTKVEVIIKPVKDKSPTKGTDDLVSKLNTELSNMIFYYEKNNIEKSKGFIKDSIIPTCEIWKEEVNKLLSNL